MCVSPWVMLVNTTVCLSQEIFLTLPSQSQCPPSKTLSSPWHTLHTPSPTPHSCTWRTFPSDFLGRAWCGDEGSKPLTSYLESQDWSSGSNLKVALAYPPVSVPQPGRHDVPWVLASKGPSASVHTAKYLDSMMVPDRTQHDTVASMDTEARASLEAHLKDYRLVPGVKCTEKSHILMLKPTWLESVWTRGGQNRATSVIAGLSVYTRPAKGRKASWRELTVLSDFPKPQEGSNSLSTHSNTTGQ